MSQCDYLVEVGIKSWAAPLTNGSHCLDIFEVRASSDHEAMWAALKHFETRMTYEPNYRKQMEALGYVPDLLCARECVPA